MEKNEHIFRLENYSVYDDEIFEEKEKEKEDIKIIDENDLKDKKYISQGSFGVVHRYTYKKNNIEKYVAVKKEFKSNVKYRDKVRKEYKKLKYLKHKNIIKFYGIIPAKDCDSIVMEYCQINLEYFLKEFKKKLIAEDSHAIKLPDLISLNCIMQIASGMNEAHSKNIIHADLSSKNVLIKRIPTTDNFNDILLKIIDFSDESVTRGTPRYWAPELALEKIEKPNKECDVYSFGVLCWEILTLDVPFESLNGKNILYVMNYIANFHKNKNRLNFNNYPDCPKQIADLISDCFNAAGMRPSFKYLFDKLKSIQLEQDDLNSRQSNQDQDQAVESIEMMDQDVRNFDKVSIPTFLFD